MSLAQQALDAQGTATAAEDRARGYLAKCKALAIQYGRPRFAERLTLVHGRRPGIKAKQGLKRPYWRVQASLSDDDWAADSRTARATPRQIMRMAKRA